MNTEDLIVQLTRSLEPVEPLARPAARLAGWIAISSVLAGAGAIAIGPRADIAIAWHQPQFLVLAAFALVSTIAAAGAALVSSVPGAGRSPAQRMLPFAIAAAWALTLVAMLARDGDPIARLMALPLHLACVLEIAGFAVLPGWALFTMLRRAAPLRVTWSAALAAFAALAIGAAATQVVCPLDDPAHHLAGHFVPMAAFAVMATGMFRDSLGWTSRSRP